MLPPVRLTGHEQSGYCFHRSGSNGTSLCCSVLGQFKLTQNRYILSCLLSKAFVQVVIGRINFRIESIEL